MWYFHRRMSVIHWGGGLCMMLLPVWGGRSLFRGVFLTETPSVWLRMGGMHPTEMLSCNFLCLQKNLYMVTRKHFSRMHTTCSSLYMGGSQGKGGLPGQKPPQTDPLDRDLPGRNMGPDNQTGRDIIQRPPVNRQTPVKTLPCPKLRLRAVTIACKFAWTPKFYLAEVENSFDPASNSSSLCVPSCGIVTLHWTGSGSRMCIIHSSSFPWIEYAAVNTM